MKDYVIGEPYCDRVELLDTDTMLVVACDGLWDVVSDQDVCDTLRYENGIASFFFFPVCWLFFILYLFREKEEPAQALANKLLVKALKAGSTDNISIVTVILK